MEPTICPWCQTEIVWDEEIGPEENCPHCDNELKGYRSISVTLDDSEEEGHQEIMKQPYNDDDFEHGDILNKPFWGSDEGTVPEIRTLEKYGEAHDLMAYEESVEKVLDHQDETPECFHCREYMMLAGTQRVDGEGFNPAALPFLKRPLLAPPFDLNVYICSGCFHIQYSLAEDDRLRLIEGLTPKSNK
ncbi:hypothetical protein [Paenibacillus dakarensis]|uniref:hypothetical protein n=1 Tax=Paenibacillus dakarensis TaxID=1527293 RepID=UPI0006D53819|nr:hypothetical protein [Paenibacillus dakarensis]